MIVKDKKYIVERANDITTSMLKQLIEYTRDLLLQDDPAENIYLFLYIISFFNIKLIKAIEEFCKTYSIKDMTKEKIIELTTEIMKEIY
jgi:hypothetical protein